MRYLKTIPLSIFATGLLLLAGCASETPADPATDATEGQGVWVQFEIAGTSENSGTRADGADGVRIGKNSDESLIKTACVMLVDTDANVCGIGTDVTIDQASGSKTATITANMGLTTRYTVGETYRVYVFANLPSSTDLTGVSGKAISEVGETIIGSLAAKTASDVTSSGLPMSSLDTDAENVKVVFAEGGDYSTKKKACVAQENNSESAGTLYLTPFYTRIDIVEHDGITDFTYPVSYKNEKNEDVKEVNVKFKQATVKNVADNVYLLPKGKTADYSIESPAPGTFGAASPVTFTKGIAMYLPEYVPAVASGGKVCYKDASYIELDGILTTTGCTAIDADVKKAIDGATKSKTNPALYYYDNGEIQSGLTLKAPAAGATDWQTITYDNTLEGYKVTYRFAIRHDAGTGKNLEDGLYHPLEYGLVRNYIYNVGVASVSSLPHPWKEDGTDEVERPDKDIELVILVGKWIKRTQDVKL